MHAALLPPLVAVIIIVCAEEVPFTAVTEAVVPFPFPLTVTYAVLLLVHVMVCVLFEGVRAAVSVVDAPLFNVYAAGLTLTAVVATVAAVVEFKSSGSVLHAVKNAAVNSRQYTANLRTQAACKSLLLLQAEVSEQYL